ncbi:MAG TPA: phosphocholine cytidylyltransferase family protein [Pyrinomonadaceae bacterium]|nr:phosphocholine cytidylyltransferase family protein [Pyrinomonadaceae bacterium]
MKGIILAAGAGTRLNGAAVKPKCLVEVGGMSLLRRQIRALRKANINDIVVVLGFEGQSIKHECDESVHFVENPNFAQTSSLYSLWLARHHLTDGFVVLNSDVLFHPQILEDLLQSSFSDALLISYQGEKNEPLGDEEMKVKVEEDVVVDISKEMNPSEADGENVGIVKFSPSGAKLLIEYMDDLIARGFSKAWAPRAFLEFALHHRLHAVSTRGYPWIEIDFPEDYQRAVNEVCPNIDCHA